MWVAMFKVMLIVLFDFKGSIKENWVSEGETV